MAKTNLIQKVFENLIATSQTKDDPEKYLKEKATPIHSQRNI